MDKIQKIREEIENKLEVMQYQVHRKDAYKELKYVLDYIDSLQEEPVSEEWIKELRTKLDSMSKEEFERVCEKYGVEEEKPVSEDLEEASKNFALNNTPWDDCKDEIQESFKAGANWQKAKDKYITGDLGEYINELSKQFPEVSFAKLSRIVVRVAKWQKEHLWKPADGDDLPEIDREVIALTQPYPNDEHLRVVFAHRPNKYANVWNSDLGEEQVVEIERHGKGGWNIPDVKFWLNCSMPKEIEL